MFGFEQGWSHCSGLIWLILLVNRQSIMGDSFIRDYIDDVLRNIRTLVLVKLIKPYTRVELSFIAKVKKGDEGNTTKLLTWDPFVQRLNITVEEVEELAVGLILDKKISGQIDQVNQRLELEQR